jgi:hypothetical protein
MLEIFMVRFTFVVLLGAAVAAGAGCGKETATPAPKTSMGTPPAAAPSTPLPPAVSPPAVTTPPPAAGAADASSTATAKDTPANNPTGTLTKAEESNAMPKAGQANNHSSTSMEGSRKQ